MIFRHIWLEHFFEKNTVDIAADGKAHKQIEWKQEHEEFCPSET